MNASNLAMNIGATTANNATTAVAQAAREAQEQKLINDLKELLNQLNLAQINKNQFFDAVKTMCVVQEVKLVELDDLNRMEDCSLNELRAAGHVGGLYALMVGQRWVTSEGKWLTPSDTWLIDSVARKLATDEKVRRKQQSKAMRKHC